MGKYDELFTISRWDITFVQVYIARSNNAMQPGRVDPLLVILIDLIILVLTRASLGLRLPRCVVKATGIRTDICGSTSTSFSNASRHLRELHLVHTQYNGFKIKV
jgi:hypothetical protein